VAKAGEQLPPDAELTLKARDHPWVSRGALKLDPALDTLGVDPSGTGVLDVGASTGGFTEVLLHRGAARVYAVDAGTNQLAWKLRRDPRVRVLENTNARYLTAGQVPTPADGVVCDASFISLTTLLPAPLARAAPGAWLIALIKPQFEAGRERLGAGGVVRDEDARRDACDTVRAWLDARPGWRTVTLMDSPVTGPRGNREVLLHAVHDPAAG